MIKMVPYLIDRDKKHLDLPLGAVLKQVVDLGTTLQVYFLVDDSQPLLRRHFESFWNSEAINPKYTHVYSNTGTGSAPVPAPIGSADWRPTRDGPMGVTGDTHLFEVFPHG